jgi:hypothetical protein
MSTALKFNEDKIPEYLSKNEYETEDKSSRFVV